jgi:hypothetical protein
VGRSGPLLVSRRSAASAARHGECPDEVAGAKLACGRSGGASVDIRTAIRRPLRATQRGVTQVSADRLVEPSGVNADEHVVGGDLGYGDPDETQNVGAAVAVVHDGPHRRFPRRRSGDSTIAACSS